MKKFFALISAVAVLLPSFASAAQLQFDTAITPGSVLFSPAVFYAGEPVRIYANITNLGTADITGGVSFFQGASALAAPSPFSLKAGGATEDVWIDWTPAEGTYNIMVKIETNTSDQNPANNTYVTPMMTVTKRPPPPVVQPPAQASPSFSSPSSGSLSSSSTALPQAPSNNQNNSLLLAQKQSTIDSVAKQIAEKLTPKRQVIPPVQKQKVASAKEPVIQKTIVAQAEPQPLAHIVSTPKPQQAVLGESVKRPVDPVQQAKAQPQGFGANHVYNENQNDPVRTGIAFSVVFALVFLGAGFYFLKMSRA